MHYYFRLGRSFDVPDLSVLLLQLLLFAFFSMAMVSFTLFFAASARSFFVLCCPLLSSPAVSAPSPKTLTTL